MQSHLTAHRTVESIDLMERRAWENEWISQKILGSSSNNCFARDKPAKHLVIQYYCSRSTKCLGTNNITENSGFEETIVVYHIDRVHKRIALFRITDSTRRPVSTTSVATHSVWTLIITATTSILERQEVDVHPTYSLATERILDNITRIRIFIPLAFYYSLLQVVFSKSFWERLRASSVMTNPVSIQRKYGTLHLLFHRRSVEFVCWLAMLLMIFPSRNRWHFGRPLMMHTTTTKPKLVGS